MNDPNTEDVLAERGIGMINNDIYENIPAPQLNHMDFFTFNEDHGDAVDQLRTMGRFIDAVPPDGNCMFESIARQIKGNTLVTAQTIRKSVYNVGREQFERFIDFYEGDKDLYFEDLERLRQDGTWNVAIGDLALSIAQVALDVQIIVVRSFHLPLAFPDNDAPITESTIVIVQSTSQTHYDSTKLFHEGCENGSAVDQMRNLSRRIVSIPEDGNSFFNAVSDQLHDSCLTAEQLRQLVCTFFETSSKDLSYSCNVRKTFKENYSWSYSSVKPATKALANSLGRQIVVLADYTDPIIYPERQDSISNNAIIIIQDRLGQHFDSTKARGKTFYDNGLASRQMKDLNRCLAPMANTEDSFFHAISYHLSKQEITSEDLKLFICDSIKKHVEDFLPANSIAPDVANLLRVVKSLEENNNWSPSLLKPVMKFLADVLVRQIVVLADYVDPIIYPENDDPVYDDAIVVIQDGIDSHFDATKLREPKLHSESGEVESQEKYEYVNYKRRWRRPHWKLRKKNRK